MPGCAPCAIYRDRVGRGKGGDICTIMADTHCCMKETNTTLKSDFPQIKKQRMDTNPFQTLPKNRNECFLIYSMKPVLP